MYIYHHRPSIAPGALRDFARGGTCEWPPSSRRSPRGALGSSLGTSTPEDRRSGGPGEVVDLTGMYCKAEWQRLLELVGTMLKYSGFLPSALVSGNLCLSTSRFWGTHIGPVLTLGSAICAAMVQPPKLTVARYTPLSTSIEPLYPPYNLNASICLGSCGLHSHGRPSSDPACNTFNTIQELPCRSGKERSLQVSLEIGQVTSYLASPAMWPPCQTPPSFGRCAVVVRWMADQADAWTAQWMADQVRTFGHG